MAATFKARVFTMFVKDADLVLQSLGVAVISAISLSVTLLYTAPSTGSDFQNLQMMMVSFTTVLVGWMLWSFISKVICNLWGSEVEFRDSMRTIRTRNIYNRGGNTINWSVHFIHYMDLDSCIRNLRYKIYS